MSGTKITIGVIDGQGGGIGSYIIKNLHENLTHEGTEIVALGTNAVATAAMMKAKANRGASGENAIVRTVPSLDMILGTLAVIIPNTMMGEITPAMARAVSGATADKILLPMKVSGLELVGLNNEPLPHLIDSMVNKINTVLAKT